MADRRFGKDFFTALRLPVSRAYLQPPGRGRLFAIGGIAALVAGGVFAFDAFVGRAKAVASGPLTDSHALFAEDCATCHTPFKGVEARKCSSCHERAGNSLPEYGWQRHYTYRSQDFDRSAPASREAGCATCHGEHRGREASLQEVADARCLSCHEDVGFANDHPQFAFAAEEEADPANLIFPHILHVREVMKEEDLRMVESACVTCHQPDPAGRNFLPISFGTSCDACHMSSERTPPLPVVQGSGPGVQTLQDIRASGAPGTQWAHYWDPNEFRALGPRVTKSPVYHADPWVLHNLRRMRKELYPGAELADLLVASAGTPSPASSPRALHEEAVQTLRAQIEALGGEPSPDVQDELDRLTELVEDIEARLEDPWAPVDETRFMVGSSDLAPGVSTGEIDVEAYRSAIGDLTERCTSCHLIEDATLARVQKDQRTMVRAEFDHQAHVIHARCLDCHSRVPFDDWIDSEEDPPSEVDRAGIQNLPGIESCRSCHSSQGPSTACTSCHLFHPDRAGHADLTRVQRRPR